MSTLNFSNEKISLTPDDLRKLRVALADGTDPFRGTGLGASAAFVGGKVATGAVKASGLVVNTIAVNKFPAQPARPESLSLEIKSAPEAAALHTLLERGLKDLGAHFDKQYRERMEELSNQLSHAVANWSSMVDAAQKAASAISGQVPNIGLESPYEYVRVDYQNGKKVEAIKFARGFSGVGLKEAKDGVEAGAFFPKIPNKFGDYNVGKRPEDISLFEASWDGIPPGAAYITDSGDMLFKPVSQGEKGVYQWVKLKWRGDGYRNELCNKVQRILPGCSRDRAMLIIKNAAYFPAIIPSACVSDIAWVGDFDSIPRGSYVVDGDGITLKLVGPDQEEVGISDSELDEELGYTSSSGGSF